MSTTTYYYSKFQIYFMVLAFTGIGFYLLYATINFVTNNLAGSLMFGALFILDFAGVFYLTRKFLLPALRNEPAIELDGEYLQYYIGKWKLPWKDIEKIDEFMGGMTITLKDGRTKGVGLKYVNGKYDEIVDKMNEYIESSL